MESSSFKRSMGKTDRSRDPNISLLIGYCSTWMSCVDCSRRVLQHCTGFARLVWGRLRVHRAFVYSDWFVCPVGFCSLLPRKVIDLEIQIFRVWSPPWVVHVSFRVMSHIWMSHVTHMNASRHTHEWVMSQVRCESNSFCCGKDTATHCNTLRHTATHCNTQWMSHVTGTMWIR